MKEKSPNPKIDKAIEDLLKSVTTKGEEFSPEEVTAKVRVVTLAVSWEKVKHHIKEDGEFDPAAI